MTTEETLERIAHALEIEYQKCKQRTANTMDSRTEEHESLKAEIFWEIQYAIREALKPAKLKP